MLEEEHPDHSLVRLPTKAELDKGYVFGRDCHYKVAVSTMEEPSGPLTNQRVMNIDHSFHIYELIEGEAHKDVSTITLRPMLYRDTSEGVEGAEPIMFDGEGDRTLFLETVNAWITTREMGVLRLSYKSICPCSPNPSPAIQTAAFIRQTCPSRLHLSLSAFRTLGERTYWTNFNINTRLSMQVAHFVLIGLWIPTRLRQLLVSNVLVQ